METFHRAWQTGHTAVTFKGTPAIICDGLRCFSNLKSTGKRPISSQDLKRQCPPPPGYKTSVKQCEGGIRGLEAIRPPCEKTH